ncbi:hypothetical protein EVJ29_13150 [Exiguobacterium sp. SH4S7]|uniref:hypothetical protein n=1 Tax=Exiguobacterium sp. SH4S7 TaxID=2510958 RepID=UPI0010407AD5|nr:hypothetical protein [Exiguobacterium sp. SH4S7]TCI33831.1 hypothetical protein EVJ29_13150 [Exiguobacterium sp. SH4S7]
MIAKAQKFWFTFFEQMKVHYDVTIEVTSFSEGDLDHFYRERRHKEIAGYIERQIRQGIFAPPDGTANPIHGKHSDYVYIKILRAGIRIIYLPKKVDGTTLMVLDTIGYRADDAVYNEFQRRRPHT